MITASIIVVAILITLWAVYHNLNVKMRDVDGDLESLNEATAKRDTLSGGDEKAEADKRVAKAKHEYNNSVEDFNRSIDTFPGMIFGRMERFGRRAPVVLTDEEAKLGQTGVREMKL